MADVIVTLKVMPTSPDADLAAIEEGTKKVVVEFGADVARVEQEPVAFGLKAVKVTFIMSEDLGSPDPVEEKVAALELVESAQVVDVRRTLG